MNEPQLPTRREILKQSIVAGAAMSLPWIMSSAAVAREGAIGPNDKINLGVIGIGPRCTYDLTAMLTLPDVHCVAIADVQASRRNAGKALVDGHYGNQDCVLFRDFRELLARKDIDAVIIATGDRWHAPASMLAAKAGKDVYSEKPCGMTIANCQELADTMKRTGRVFQAGTQRRSVPNFQQAIELAHSGKLGKIHTLYASVYIPRSITVGCPANRLRRATWSIGICGWGRLRGGRTTASMSNGGWRGYYDFDSGAKLLDWGAHTVDLCQWANHADDTMPIEYVPSPTNIICRYANGVKLVLDFLKTPFGDRGPNWITRLGTCPVRFVGDEGWVETGDSGEIEVQPESLKAELKAAGKKVTAWTCRPMPGTSSTA